MGEWENEKMGECVKTPPHIYPYTHLYIHTSTHLLINQYTKTI